MGEDKCWARSFSPCSGGMSGEHYLSAGLWLHDTVVVEGLTGSAKTIPVEAMTVRALCVEHNRALSPLDQAGIDVMNALRRLEQLRDVRATFVPDPIPTGALQPIKLVAAGCLFERWVLKTAAGAARVVRRGVNNWEPSAELVAIIFGGTELPDGAGLGLLGRVGMRVGGIDRARFKFGARAFDTEPTAMILDLRGGYRFVVSWRVPLLEFHGFNDEGEAFARDRHLLVHPIEMRFNSNLANLDLSLTFDWDAGVEMSPSIVALRDRYPSARRRRRMR